MGLADVKAQVMHLIPPSTETSCMNSFLVQYLLPKEPLLEVRSRGVCVCVCVCVCVWCMKWVVPCAGQS